MESLQIMELLRRIMAAGPVMELPSYPAPLVECWSHPDILLAMLGRQKKRGFVFQPLQKHDSTRTDSALSALPVFVWHINASVNNFSATATAFLDSLQKAIFPEKNEETFAVIAANEVVRAGSSRGICWKVLFDGVPCGSLNLFSEILAIGLAEPSAILCLDLSLLQRFLSPERFSAKMEWGNGVVADQLVSLAAWYEPVSRPLSHVEIGGEIMQAAALGATNAKRSLCRLIDLYLTNSVLLTASSELIQLFSRSVHEVAGRVGSDDLQNSAGAK